MSAFGRSQRQYFNPDVLFRFRDIEKPVQSHLRNVYSLLSIGLILSTMGALLFTYSKFMQSWSTGMMILSMITSIGSLAYIYLTENNEQNLKSRIASFLLFAFSSGVGLGPLVLFSALVNPSTLPSAFMGTALIFISFTIASLLTRNRYMLFLGGILATAISVLSTFSLMNLFLRSQAIFQAELYIGLILFCGFIVYDTQLMVFKRQNGDTDCVRHAVDLFVDVIEVFRHLLIILNTKRDRNERRND